MNKNLKSRNLQLLSRYHELTLSTKKLEKQKHIEIAEEMKISQSVVRNTVKRYYDNYIIELKKLTSEGLTELNERFIAKGMTEKQSEYIKQKLFGMSESKAIKKAGYKSKGIISKLKKNKSVQDIIEEERLKVLKNTKYTFQYNYNSLGEIADKTKQRIEEREITEKQSDKNGQELSKTVSEKSMYGVGVQAIAQMNKMVGFNFEDTIKAKKLEIDKEKIGIDQEKNEILRERNKIEKDNSGSGKGIEDMASEEVNNYTKKYGGHLEG